MKDSIIFIDEGNEFVFTDDFASIIQNTDNYYVIVTRERIPSLPYSVEEIYGIRDSGKYGTSKRTYNEFFHLYQLEDYQTVVKPEIIITEDSNSGYQFFKAAAGKSCFLVLQFILSIPCTYLLRSAGAAIPEYDITFASAKIMKVLKGFLWSCCDGVWSNEVLQ